MFQYNPPGNPNEPVVRRQKPLLKYSKRSNPSVEDDRRILHYLFRKIDYPQGPDTTHLGKIMYAEQPTDIILPGEKESVQFPALDELIDVYCKHYPNQIYAYDVGRPLLESVLAAKGSIGAKIYVGIFPTFLKTLPFFPRLIWNLIYWLQSLLPKDDVQSREPRKLIFYALGPDGNPIDLNHASASISAKPGTDGINLPTGVPTTKGTISQSPPLKMAFIPNIVMADGARMGGEMTGTSPPN
ncbi:MAG: hypothetical protein LH606_21780 [Cytophagaceae bacterium]|nr:hypothetical protein [Cytophagaceae bacterium]